MTLKRDEFLADLKARASELVRAGDLVHAVSIMSDAMNKRVDFKPSPALILAGHMHAMNDDRDGVMRWIESFS